MEWIVTAVILYAFYAFFVKKGKSSSRSTPSSRAAYDARKHRKKPTCQSRSQGNDNQAIKAKSPLSDSLNESSSNSKPELSPEAVPGTQKSRPKLTPQSLSQGNDIQATDAKNSLSDTPKGSSINPNPELSPVTVSETQKSPPKLTRHFKRRDNSPSFRTAHDSRGRLPKLTRPPIRGDDTQNVGVESSRTNTFTNNSGQSKPTLSSEALPETTTSTPKLTRQPQQRSSFEQAIGVEISLKGTFSDSSRTSKAAENNDLAGSWIPLGQEISIKGKTIQGGGFYLRDSKDDNGRLDDPSMVDATLDFTIGSTYDYEDPEISYYPCYHDLNTLAKGAYLDWLASDRKDPKVPITYPFIYFYGIERRFLIDHLQCNKVDMNELRILFKEVNRLRNVHDGNRSFRAYANRLMDLMILYKPELFPSINQPFISGNSSLSLRYQIGLSALHDKPIGPALACGWIRYHPNYTGGTVMRRCEQAFKKLFVLRYKQQYGQGFNVKPNKRNLDVRYTAASSLFSYYGRTTLELPKIVVPDPFELVGPLRKLEKIASPVLDDLIPLSRYLGKEGHSSNDIEASLLLPKALIAQNIPPALSKIKKVLSSHLDSNTVTVR